MSRVYRIGEVAKILNVKTSVLRFWESEFKQIRPKRTDTGQRYYSEKDMELLQKIYTLLYKEGLTIPGAKKILTKSDNSEIENNEHQNKNILKYEDTLIEIYCELEELLSLLPNNKSTSE